MSVWSTVSLEFYQEVLSFRNVEFLLLSTGLRFYIEFKSFFFFFFPVKLKPAMSCRLMV